MNRILVDTGPLVALLSPADQFHEPCLKALSTIPAPLYTCWPVLTEAAWLLRGDPSAVERLLASGPAGLYKIFPLTEEDAPVMAAIMKRYRSMRPQLAHAALVHLASREGIDTIFTLDCRDFRVYRPGPHRVFRMIP